MGRPAYLLRPLTPCLLPRSVSGTALPAPDSAHLAAGERRAVDPVPHLTELAPPGYASPETIEAAHLAVVESKAALAVVKKQKDTGIWGGNLLGLAPSAAQGIKDVGTIPQYRRLLQLGWPRAGRPFKLADRVLFRLLSPGRRPRPAVRVPEVVKSDAGGRGLGARDHAGGGLGRAGGGRLRR